MKLLPLVHRLSVALGCLTALALAYFFASILHRGDGTGLTGSWWVDALLFFTLGCGASLLAGRFTKPYFHGNSQDV